MADPAINTTIRPTDNDGVSAWDALPYLYLLRVQLITFLALLSFPFIALWFAPNLLLGVFDITPSGMVFVTLSANLASWTVMVTAWQVFLYGPERFHIRPFPFFSSIVRQLPTRMGHSPVFCDLLPIHHSHRNVCIQERRHVYISAIAERRIGGRCPCSRHFDCGRPVPAPPVVG